jgi:glucose-6-phosphate 1-dehydrogenase
VTSIGFAAFLLRVYSTMPERDAATDTSIPNATSVQATQALPSRVADPCVIVLFGATGDLTHRKLLPALCHLAQSGQLSNQYAVLGFARRDWTHDRFREEMAKSIAGHSVISGHWPEFARHLFISEGNFDDLQSFERLKAQLDALDAEFGTKGNRLFYLATAPEYFSQIVENLGKASLIYPPQSTGPWSRVVIEKPFGHDTASAIQLHQDISQWLTESQTYRIDHYLGKETVQNILALRFGNTVFESIWNRSHVASIQFLVSETVGMSGGRGAFYDQAGAIRDMVQNHMMQLLGMICQEPPGDLSADSLRNEMVKVLQALPKWSAEDVAKNVVRGQYTSGVVEGEEVPGYAAERNVDPTSSTETYLAIRLTLENWRWAGVPIYLRTGKRLPKRTTEIAIQFRRPPAALYEAQNVHGDQGANHLILRIQPDEGASLFFQAKVPGSRRRLQEVHMDFGYSGTFAGPPPEAYERLLLDVILGDQSLFTRIDFVLNSWKFVTTIMDAWKADAIKPLPYAAGTWGPVEAEQLLAQDGFRWRKPS